MWPRRDGWPTAVLRVGLGVLGLRGVRGGNGGCGIGGFSCGSGRRGLGGDRSAGGDGCGSDRKRSRRLVGRRCRGSRRRRSMRPRGIATPMRRRSPWSFCLAQSRPDRSRRTSPDEAFVVSSDFVPSDFGASDFDLARRVVAALVSGRLASASAWRRPERCRASASSLALSQGVVRALRHSNRCGGLPLVRCGSIVARAVVGRCCASSERRGAVRVVLACGCRCCWRPCCCRPARQSCRFAGGSDWPGAPWAAWNDGCRYF